ncbi:MAG: hypothetical protein FJ290_07915 [Planctomycetes bacterium]|nr:hypothetical protein [Planctomycetota bacterium]
MRFFSNLLAGCMGLPMPLQLILLLVVGGGSAATLGYVLTGFMGPAAWIVVAGVFLVVLLILGFVLLVKWMRKRRANPMERDIVGQAGAAPQAVSAASRRAALDDLRRNFEAGVAKFRAAGKNLYSLPWYMVVGEPGSGKTEAVRHSCIGFPPGLHDPLQGAGGTINMNWWFTDKAVILDTAGRLMFEEVPAGTTSEWQEFLRLLRIYRYNCPVNGLVLVIPADTLITDTADQIKAKANKIAEQLHQIQRVLEVRFPVFVVITKCDLINGFREFFDGVTDPDLQQQILGWSNPAPLDDRFNPELLSQHLEMVCDRLRRRRLGLMIDPIHTEDPTGHRVDQVDALYALPQSLARIAPRLRHYLDHVFAGGEWTGKPLFMRGIYFTSSMREGHALDEELAEALSVPVQSIQEAREWDRERSYFLKDLFLEKIFRERGLVTRAIHAGKQRRRRRAIVLTTGFLSVAVLAFFTWFGARSLRNSIGIHRDHWVAAADTKNWRRDDEKGPEYWKPIVAFDFVGSTDYTYNGQSLIKVGGEEVRVAQFHAKLAELAAQPIKVPWVFWLAKLGTDLTSDRLAAQRLILERSVLRPLVDAVRQKMVLPDGEAAREEALKAGWPDDFTRALAELIRLEAPDAELPDLAPLFQCALYRRPDKEESKEADKKYEQYILNLRQYEKDSEGLVMALRWLAAQQKGQPGAARQALAAATPHATRAIHDGVERYIRHWTARAERDARQLDDLVKLKEFILKDYRDAEQRLLDSDEEFGPRLERPTEKKVEVIRDALAAWQARLDELDQLRAKAESKLAALSVLDGPISPIFDKSTSAIVKDVSEAFTKFRIQASLVPSAPTPAEAAPTAPDATPKPPEAPSPDAKRWKDMAATINGRLSEALERLRKVVPAAVTADIRRVDAEFLNQLDAGKVLMDRLVKDGLLKARKEPKARLYELRMLMYRLGDAERGKGDAVPEVVSLAKGVEAVEDAVASACTQITELQELKPDGFRFKDAAAVSAFTAKQLAMPQRIYKALSDALTKAPDAPEKVATEVERTAKALPAIIRAKLPCTNLKGGPYDVKYHPEAVRKAIAVCREAGLVLADRKHNILEREKLDTMRAVWQGAIAKYVTGPYLAYWTQTVPRDLESQGVDWAPFAQEVERTDFFEVFVTLRDVGTAMGNAMHSDIEQALPTDARQAFTAARENVQAQVRKLNNEVYVQRCRLVRANWCKLGADPFKARSTLAIQLDDDVFEQYLPFEWKNPEEFLDKYWTELTYEFLRLLCDGAAKQGRGLLDDLTRRYSRFPLVRPQEQGKPLAAAEVTEARKIVEALVLQWKESPAPPPAPEGERATRGRAVVRKRLEEIRRLRIPPAEWEWLKKVKAVLDGLPTADRALKCELWVPAAQPNPTAAHRWVHIRVLQGGKEIGKGNTLPAADYKVCDLWYPGEKVEIDLYRNPVDPEPNRAVVVDDPWAMVRLLHPGKLTDPLHPGDKFSHLWDVEKPTEKKEVFDPVKRNILLTIEDDQRQPRLLRLRLEFEKGLPRIEDWPASGGQ